MCVCVCVCVCVYVCVCVVVYLNIFTASGVISMYFHFQKENCIIFYQSR